MEDLGWEAPGAGRDPVDVALVGCGSEENLALGYVAAACAAADLRAEIVVCRDAEELDAAIGRVLALHPRALGLSIACQAHAAGLMRFADQVRRAGFLGHICAGGRFATVACDRLLRDARPIDSVVLNEGEQTIVELLAALRSDSSSPDLHKIPGLAWRAQDGVVSHTPERPAAPIDSIAWPRRPPQPLHRAGIGAAPMLGSRSTSGESSIGSVRWRRPSDLANEMAWLYFERGVRLFDFVDDTFLFPGGVACTSRLEELRTELDRRGLTESALIVSARPGEISADVADALARAGVLFVRVTIDGATWRAEGDRAIALLASHGVEHAFSVELFDPDTTIRGIDRGLSLLAAHARTPFDCCRACVYAGSALEERMLRDKRLQGSYLGWSYDLDDPRADLMSRIAYAVFYHRACSAGGVPHAHASLRMDAAILRRFMPHAWTAKEQEAVVEFSRRLGDAVVSQLRAMLDYVLEADLDDDAGTQAFAAQRLHEVRRIDAEMRERMEELRGAVRQVRGQ